MNKGITGIIEAVLYCPNVSHNPLSVSKMQRVGKKMIFNRGVQIVKSGKTITQAEVVNNLLMIEHEVEITTLNSEEHSFQVIELIKNFDITV